MLGFKYKYQYSYGAGESGPSPWTPADITTALWLDANDADTITEATGVSQWDDKSGNSRDVTQGTGSRQPIYDSVNKKVTFDGSDDYMKSDSFTELSQPNTLFVVHKFNGGLGVFQNIFDGANTGSRNAYYIDTSKALAFDAGTFKTSTYIANTSDTLISGVEFNSATNNSSIRVFGDPTFVNQACGTNGIDTFVLGRYDIVPGSYLNGDINELIFINDSLSDATRQKIEGYLAWKWDGINGDTALVDALPVGHPYKSAAPTA